MMTPTARAAGISITLALAFLTTSVGNLAYGQIDPRRGPAGCVPVSERQMERGCYILVSNTLGELPEAPLYWHIDSFSTRAAAESAKGPRGTVMEALGKIWLLSIAEPDSRSSGGTHETKIGPLRARARITASAGKNRQADKNAMNQPGDGRAFTAAAPILMR